MGRRWRALYHNFVEIFAHVVPLEIQSACRRNCVAGRDAKNGLCESGRYLGGGGTQHVRQFLAVHVCVLGHKSIEFIYEAVLCCTVHAAEIRNVDAI